jgi:hypothetical protein
LDAVQAVGIEEGQIRNDLLAVRSRSPATDLALAGHIRMGTCTHKKNMDTAAVETSNGAGFD